jgi:hypothetical protein
MIKKWVQSQIGNFIPKHKSPLSKGQIIFDWGMQYTIENITFKTIRLCPCTLQICFFKEDMSIQSFETTRVPILGLLLESPRKKCHLNVTPMESHKYTIRRGMVPPPKGCELCKSCV